MKKLIITALIIGFTTTQIWPSTSSTNLGPVKGNIYQPNKKIETPGKTTAQIEQEANQSTGSNLFDTISKSAAQVEQEQQAAQQNLGTFEGIWGAVKSAVNNLGSNKLGTEEKTYENLRTTVFNEIGKLIDEVKAIIASPKYANTQITNKNIDGLINQLHGLIYGGYTGIQLVPLAAEIYSTIKNSDTFKNIQKTYLAEIKNVRRTKPASALNSPQDQIANLLINKVKQLLQSHNVLLELKNPTLSEDAKNQIIELIQSSKELSIPLTELSQPAYELFSPMESLQSPK